MLLPNMILLTMCNVQSVPEVFSSYESHYNIEFNGSINLLICQFIQEVIIIHELIRPGIPYTTEMEPVEILIGRSTG